METLLDYITFSFFTIIPLITISFFIVIIQKMIKTKKEENKIKISWIIGAFVLGSYSISILLFDLVILFFLMSAPSLM